MIIHTGNRLERLVEKLAESLSQPAGTALEPEIIVVQSRGMARWVSLALARHLGICMNVEFPFPRAFVARVLRAFFPEMEEEQAFGVPVLSWRIYGLLATLANRPEFSQVQDYLADDDGLKRFQLAHKLAGLFDQYLVFRPDLLLEWEDGAEPADWQAALWRALTSGRHPAHLAAVHAALSSRMAAPPTAGTLPARVSVFGVSWMPPLYLRVFFELARHCDVRLFCLHPSQEYFGDDPSPRRRARCAASCSDRSRATDLPVGNPLLTSLGRLHRDFIETRLELEERLEGIARELPGDFVEPGDATMLAVLQGDILHARDRGNDPDTPRLPVAPRDRSIQLHACHSPMREVEVLHDALLDLFQTLPDLRPDQVLVMTPDIEKYAPLIEAVFGCPESTAHRIPFSVADRRPRRTSPVVETFLALLALPGQRCTAAEVFAILEREPVRRRFDFSDSDLAQIRRWIVETAIRWGIDGAHRQRLGLPALEANTWRAGLRRLLLGYAMAGRNHLLFEGILPCDEVEGDRAELLGRFLTAIEALFHFIRTLPETCSLKEWVAVCDRLLATFFPAHTPADMAGLNSLRDALNSLRRVAAAMDTAHPVTFRVVRHFLEQALDGGESHGGFLAGGVTFCTLQPSRSIPARVLCLLGMNDQAFPRRSSPAGFDRMARAPRCGDRTARDDDRLLFLEALVSARERFYCSYVGRSITLNEELPPSVLVSELLDYLDQAFDFPEGKSARSHLLTQHPLQAFSPRYFDGRQPALFSFSDANAAASRHIGRPGKPPPAFVARPLAPPADDVADIVTLPQLVEFFSGPTRYFVRRTLGLRPDRVEDVLEETEPFEMDALTGYLLRQEMVALSLAGHAPSPEPWTARGLLPAGNVGSATFAQLKSQVETFRARVAAELGGMAADPPLAVHLQLAGCTLSGAIDAIYRGRLVLFRCAKLNAKDRLRAWVLHLAKCAVAPQPATETVLLGREETVRFIPVTTACDLLTPLLKVFREGRQRPVHFFPESALAFARREQASGGRAKKSPLEMARAAWEGNAWNNSGEAREPDNALCFGGQDPLDARFKTLARTVCIPLLAAMQEEQA